MKLSCHQQYKPPADTPPELSIQPMLKPQQRVRIEKSEYSSRNKLRMLPSNDTENRARERRQDQRTEERPWHSARKRNMVIGVRSNLEAVGGDIMCRLEIERFFDFGIRGYNEVEQDEGWED